MYKVYTLSDPFTGEIKYVGVTKNTLPKRLALHCNNAALNIQKSPKKFEWILSLREKGVRPVIEELENYENEKEALLAECFWTYQMTAWGFCLFNISFGRVKMSSTISKMKVVGKKNRFSSLLHTYASAKRKLPVIQKTKAGDVVKSWPAIIDASKSLSIDRGDITKSCKNPNKTAGGFKRLSQSNIKKAR